MTHIDAMLTKAVQFMDLKEATRLVTVSERARAFYRNVRQR